MKDNGNNHDEIEKFRRGDPETHRKVEGLIRRALWRYSRIRHLEDDIVQDTKMRMMTASAKPDFELSKNLQAFVYHMTKCSCLDEHNRTKKMIIVAERLTKARSQRSEGIRSGHHPEKNAGQDLDKIKIYTCLSMALSKLSYSCQTVLHLRFTKSLKGPQIAIEINRAEGTVKARIHQCIDKLKPLFKKCTDNAGFDWDDVLGIFGI